jgi:hypothetical protein
MRRIVVVFAVIALVFSLAGTALAANDSPGAKGHANACAAHERNSGNANGNGLDCAPVPSITVTSVEGVCLNGFIGVQLTGFPANSTVTIVGTSPGGGFASGTLQTDSTSSASGSVFASLTTQGGQSLTLTATAPGGVTATTTSPPAAAGCPGGF